MEQEEITRKILSLLALSNSPNENEANVAATMAARLITKYNIDIDALERETKQKAERCTHAACYEATFATGWRKYLANACAYANFCQYYIDNTSKSSETMARLGPRYTSDRWTRIVMYGRKTNVAAAASMFQYLEATILRLGNEAMREYKAESVEFGVSIKSAEWADSWRKGCTQRLYELLVCQRDEIEKEQQVENKAAAAENKVTTALTLTGLSLARKEEAETYLAELGIALVAKKQAPKVDRNAYNKGRAAADSISLARQLSGGVR